MSLQWRSFERGEVDPIIFLIHTNQCLFHPESNSAGAGECPLAFRHLIDERTVHSISIEMHVAIPLRRPKEMTPVAVEVQIVGHVHPTRIRLGKDTSGGAVLAVGKVQSHLGLRARHRHQTESAPVRQPLRAHEVFEWTVGNLYPRRSRVSDLSDAETHLWIRSARSCIA